MNVSHEVYGSLKEAGIDDDESIMQLIQEIGEAYVKEFEDIEKDLRKSRPLGVV